MTFVNIDDDFKEVHALYLRQLVNKHHSEAPKCVIFTSSTNEVITVKNLILEVCAKDRYFRGSIINLFPYFNFDVT